MGKWTGICYLQNRRKGAYFMLAIYLAKIFLSISILSHLTRIYWKLSPSKYSFSYIHPLLIYIFKMIFSKKKELWYFCRVINFFIAEIKYHIKKKKKYSSTLEIILYITIRILKISFRNCVSSLLSTYFMTFLLTKAQSL